jgi:hypothetical protein
MLATNRYGTGSTVQANFPRLLIVLRAFGKNDK